MKIKKLSEEVISKIAAGEIIERPGSVVKELVENSIDANSTKISIFTERGGRNLIKVIDNGCGISKENIELSILKHTTSKLNEENLFDINNFGFRGEALNSIVIISDFTLISKISNKDLGWKLTMVNGIKKDFKPIATNTGTIIEVKNLFISTPNRLKFLKTETTENSYLKEIITTFAIAYPEIEFQLYIDDKESIFYSRCNLETRILQIKSFGKNFIKNSLFVNKQNLQFQLKGFCGIPTLTKGNSESIKVFINKRHIKNKTIYSAIKRAYDDVILKHKFPYVILFLKIENRLIDVNVHPTKSDVRFYDEREIFNFIFNTIKNILNTIYIQTPINIQFKTDQTDSLSEIQKNYSTNILATNLLPTIPINIKNNEKSTKIDTKYLTNKQNDHNVITMLEPIFNEKIINNTLTPENYNIKNHKQNTLQKDEYQLGIAKCQIYDSYIISETKNTIFIIDQHAAHERIKYEKIKKQLQNSKIETQSLLTPEIIDLKDTEIETLLSKKESLSKLGLVINKLSINSIIVREMPIIIKNCDIKQLIEKIISNLNIEENFKFIIERIYADIACKNAIKANCMLTLEEMNALLRKIEITQNASQCNHGRPTYIKLEKNKIKNLFERT